MPSPADRKWFTSLLGVFSFRQISKLDSPLAFRKRVKDLLFKMTSASAGRQDSNQIPWLLRILNLYLDF